MLHPYQIFIPEEEGAKIQEVYKTMIGQMNLSNTHPYSRDEIPKFNIDYRGLIKYARSIGKSVVELSDKEKEKFIIGNTIDDVQKASIKLSK